MIKRKTRHLTFEQFEDRRPLSCNIGEFEYEEVTSNYRTETSTLCSGGRIYTRNSAGRELVFDKPHSPYTPVDIDYVGDVLVERNQRGEIYALNKDGNLKLIFPKTPSPGSAPNVMATSLNAVYEKNFDGDVYRYFMSNFSGDHAINHAGWELLVSRYHPLSQIISNKLGLDAFAKYFGELDFGTVETALSDVVQFIEMDFPGHAEEDDKMAFRKADGSIMVAGYGHVTCIASVEN